MLNLIEELFKKAFFFLTNSFYPATGCRPRTRAELLKEDLATSCRWQTPHKEHPWDETKRYIKIRVKLHYNIYKHAHAVVRDMLRVNEEELACNPVEMKLGHGHIKPTFWWTFFSDQGLLAIFLQVSFLQAMLLYIMLYYYIFV